MKQVRFVIWGIGSTEFECERNNYRGSKKSDRVKIGDNA